MAGLVVENERLRADAAGVRNLLAKEETARSYPNPAEERGKRVADLSKALASTLRQARFSSLSHERRRVP